MAVDAEISRSSSLVPQEFQFWDSHPYLRGMQKTDCKSATSRQEFLPSPTTPKNLPSLVNPVTSHGYRRLYDRAMDCRDERTRRPHPTGSVTLRPIDEEYPLVERLERVSIHGPTNYSHKRSPCSPLPPGSSLRRRRESLQESKIVVVRQGPSAPLSPRFTALLQNNEPIKRSRSIVLRHDPAEPAMNRRYSAASEIRISSPPDLAAASSRRFSAIDLRGQLRICGHIHYGNAKTADAFIIARPLRQHNKPSAERLDTMQAQAGPSKPGSPNRMTVRAIIRPMAVERQPFLIQRNFDLDELQATIRNGGVLPSLTRRDDRPCITKQNSSPFPIHKRIRSSAANPGTLLSSQDLKSDISMGLESFMEDAKAVPIHLDYARLYLPVLAALLLSGHVREGDVMYLPLPHAEAWWQTVKYIYTGLGELTQAMKDNIVYLAGKA